MRGSCPQSDRKWKKEEIMGKDGGGGRHVFMIREHRHSMVHSMAFLKGTHTVCLIVCFFFYRRVSCQDCEEIV